MSKLRDDALRIWQAGLEAVRSERLTKEHVRVDGRTLVFTGHAADELRVDLSGTRRVVVVGAGKAGGGMAAALEEMFGPKVAAETQLTGWVNVPADCVRPLTRIHLHAARPAGVNEPTPEGVAGTEEILRTVGSLGPDDLCIALISGGGSALLPAPIEGISLADKLAVTRFLSAAGANIVELNIVRQQLSRIKGGGLARACRAGRLIGLIISDIIGDPLELIASGPTVERTSTPEEALAVLEKFHANEPEVPAAVFELLRDKAASPTVYAAPTSHVHNMVIGSNWMAVTAAKEEAWRLGYPADGNSIYGRDAAGLRIDMTAEEEGQRLAIDAGEKICFIEGGECIVKLAPEGQRGFGGRNQQTVLAALIELAKRSQGGSVPEGIVVLSAGTDGEDGPTDAAGAFVDSEIIAEAQRRGLDPSDYLRRNDAYHFFEPLGALIKTGPTHTNVCDLRIVLVDPRRSTAP
jgi:hydroxypyruvate reductase